MPKTIEVVDRRNIERPINEVRAQFGDIAYHASHPVHAGIKFEILEEHDGATRYRQTVKILGMNQVDEFVQTTLPDGTLLSETVSGTNAGAKLFTRFYSLGFSATEVTTSIEIPLKGFRALIAPLFRAAVNQRLQKAQFEDKHDLESLRYSHYCENQKIEREAAPT